LEQRRRGALLLAAGLNQAEQHRLRAGAEAVRLPPQTLRATTIGRIACSARQLVASRPGQRRKVKIAHRSRRR